MAVSYQAIVGLQGPPGPPGRSTSVHRRYRIESPSLLWRVEHQYATTCVHVQLLDDSMRPFIAGHRIVDDATIEVYLAEATSGWMDVVYREPTEVAVI